MQEELMLFKIGDLSSLFHVGVDSIRYYEKVGLLHPIRSEKNNYRLYTLDDVRVMNTIRELLDLGFQTNEILEFQKDRTLDHMVDMLTQEETAIDQEIENLKRKKESISARLRFIHDSLALDCSEQVIEKDFPKRPAMKIVEGAMADEMINYQLAKFNKTYSDGYNIVTSYRNSKNYGDNWISAGYALWFLREAKYLNNSRMLMNTSCAISGTGFLVDRKILEKSGGWKYFLLTEDIEFTAQQVVDGEKIGYCGEAVFYDEQPTTFKQSWTQRLRWSRGFLQVFGKYGGKLFKGAFKRRFSCYDMAMNILPAMILSISGLLMDITTLIVGLIIRDSTVIFLSSKYLMEGFAAVYATAFILGGITVITEWNNIHTTKFKKVFYVFTFPIFMITYIPIAFTALFKNVEWKPIEHTKSASVESIINSGR